MTSVLDYLYGTFFGNSLTSPTIDPRAVTGRKAALSMLRDYIAFLQFARPDKNGGIIKFQIPKTSIFLEPPGKPTDLTFPSIVFRAGACELEQIGNFYLEETRDVYAADTCLYKIGEYEEHFTIECWAEEPAQRMGIAATLETALSPVEELFGLRFALPDYYNEPVEFYLESVNYTDDPDAVRSRRWVDIGMEMRFEVVKLVDTVELDPQLQFYVDDSPA